MKNLLFTLGIVLFSLNFYSQNSIDLSIYQDAKLATFGDDKGNDPLTLNMVLRADLQGKQDRLGFFVLSPEYEFADLKGGQLNRYSFNAGYTFNKWVENTEFNLRAGYGILNREGFAFGSIGLGGSISYEILDGLRLSLMANLYQRKDKEALYGTEANYTIPAFEMDFSGYIGISYRFNLNNQSKPRRF